MCSQTHRSLRDAPSQFRASVTVGQAICAATISPAANAARHTWEEIASRLSCMLPPEAGVDVGNADLRREARVNGSAAGARR